MGGKSKKAMTEVPQIDNGKQPYEHMNITHLMFFPSDTPYGNLLLKSMNILRRLDRVNLEIHRVYSSYVHPSECTPENPLHDIAEHQFYAEQVVYWLRKTADELISLGYVIDRWKESGSWPDAIQIDSIGGLKEQPPQALKDLFAPHMNFLDELNEVANAFKHSFINTDMNVVGSEYPVVFALTQKRNRLSAPVQFYSVSFEEIVRKFSALYVDVLPKIKSWANEGAAQQKQSAT
jgi:hypothetical protein